MWHLYVIAGILAAGVVVKLTMTLAGKGYHRHGKAVTRADRHLAVALAVLIPAATLALYLPLGRADLPSSPALFSNIEDQLQRQQALLRRRPLQVLLEENPEDLFALVQLGVISNSLGDYKAAVEFYRRAVTVAQKTNDMLLRVYAVSLGEMQVKASGGRVGRDAIGTFEYVLTLYPKSPIARYYLALAKAQNGEEEKAIAAWEELLSEGSPRPYWKAQVRDAMGKARQSLKDRKK